MLVAVSLLILGIAVLIYGADVLVKGASSIARRLGISALVIGLTVVAFGTSAPELIVNIFSAVKGTTDLAISNIVGSNMANILLILGTGALLMPLKVKEGTTFKEIPFALLAIVLVAVMGNDALFDGINANVLSRSDGIAFIGFFAIFMYYTFGIGKVEGEKESVERYSWVLSIMMFILGIVGLTVGGKLIVDNAVILAEIAGLSQNMIGLTIVAIGTSLPELATTVVAVRNENADIAIGNAIGSNIFNVFWVLGITSIIKPLPFDITANSDVLFTCFATLLLFLFMFIGKKRILERWQGALFLIMYIGYIGYAIWR